MKRQEREKIKASSAAGGASDEASSSSPSNDDGDNEVKEDAEGIGDKGYAHFTRSFVIIYMCQGLNEMPEQTNFCSWQLPVEAQSDILAAAIGSAARGTVAAMTSGQVSAMASYSASKKKKWSKISGKELIMDFVTKIKETQKDRTLMTTSFGMSKSPETRK